MPFFMHRVDARPFAMAGIWETHRSADGVEVSTFAVLTASANTLMAPIHHRMPVVVEREHRERWLDVSLCKRELLEDLLQPPEPEGYEIFQVSEKVNSVANDSPTCLQRGPDQQSFF